MSHSAMYVGVDAFLVIGVVDSPLGLQISRESYVVLCWKDVKLICYTELPESLKI